uniref:Uncharacterized protein n=1 Tax=Pristionchus pacificus TaxID=54126 RepID=A0A2A6CGY7_PRIPA|eukprot:PDM77350.1 hypothetical protein PRIPAC_33080 [Pristionchus pacificus]
MMSSYQEAGGHPLFSNVEPMLSISFINAGNVSGKEEEHGLRAARLGELAAECHMLINEENEAAARSLE